MTRDPRIQKIAAHYAADYAERGGFPAEGKKNVYQCDHDAAHLIVTVDREPGVTPFTVQCPHCEAAGTPGKGFYKHPAMTSAMYRVHQNLKPTHEWYRPDTVHGLRDSIAEHVLRGGLVLRKIEPVTA